MLSDACCTCAKPLSSILPLYDEKTEKSVAQDKQLGCCGRTICCICIDSNRRFENYCPFCQIASGPTSLPQGLHEPPAYSPRTSVQTADVKQERHLIDEEPPAYSAAPPPFGRITKEREEPVEDVLHFLDPSKDSIASLGISYGVPQDALRRKNGLYADHLLSARKTILIPGQFYQGPSLSPEPIESEEEELRKSKIRRFMVACKVSNYEVAVLYLEQVQQDLDMAVETYLSDEKWEADNPMRGSSTVGKQKTKKKFGLGSGLTGQI